MLGGDPQDGGAIFRVLCSRSFRVLYFGVLRGFFTNDDFHGRPIIRFRDRRFAARVTFGRGTLTAFGGGFFQTRIVRRFICVIRESFNDRGFANECIRRDGPTKDLSRVCNNRRIIFLVIWCVVVSESAKDRRFNGTTLRRFLNRFQIFRLITSDRPFSNAGRFQGVDVRHVVEGSHRFGHLSFSIDAFYRYSSWCFNYGGNIHEMYFVGIATAGRRCHVQVFHLRVRGLFRRKNRRSFFFIRNSLLFFFC